MFKNKYSVSQNYVIYTGYYLITLKIMEIKTVNTCSYTYSSFSFLSCKYIETIIFMHYYGLNYTL